MVILIIVRRVSLAGTLTTVTLDVGSYPDICEDVFHCWEAGTLTTRTVDAGGCLQQPAGYTVSWFISWVPSSIIHITVSLPSADMNGSLICIIIRITPKLQCIASHGVVRGKKKKISPWKLVEAPAAWPWRAHTCLFFYGGSCECKHAAGWRMGGWIDLPNEHQRLVTIHVAMRCHGFIHPFWRFYSMVLGVSKGGN